MREEFRRIPQGVETFRRNHPLRPPTKSEMMVGGAVAVALVASGVGELNSALNDQERRETAQLITNLLAGTTLVGAMLSFTEFVSGLIGRIPFHRR